MEKFFRYVFVTTPIGFLGGLFFVLPWVVEYWIWVLE